MKTKKEESIQSARKKYTAQFKEQVLEYADRDGVPRGHYMGCAGSLFRWFPSGIVRTSVAAVFSFSAHAHS